MKGYEDVEYIALGGLVVSYDLVDDVSNNDLVYVDQDSSLLSWR